MTRAALRGFASALLLALLGACACRPACGQAAAAQRAPRSAAPAAGPSPAASLYETLKHDRRRLHRFLRALPKGGLLHAHLSGELDPDLLIDLAAKHGYYLRLGLGAQGAIGIARDTSFKLVSPQSYEKVRAEKRDRLVPLGQWLAQADGNRAQLLERLTYQAGEPLGEFFGPIFDRIDEAGKDRRFQRPLLERVIENAHADALSYLELRINPSLAADAGVMAQFALATRECNTRWPDQEAVEVRFVVGVHRGSAQTAADLRASFQAAAADGDQGDLIVGVDLVGPEDAASAPARYLATFRELRARYPSVHLTLHAGESVEASSHVRDAILLGAERIGHGTNVLLDKRDTLRLARDNRVLFEMSLTSSHRLLHVPIEDHPFWTLLRCGVPVSLNTDDGALFHTTLTDEFTEASLAFDLDWEQLHALCENSLRASFAPAGVKREVLRRWQTRWTGYESEPRRP